MSFDSSSFYQHAAVRRLLEQELAALAPILAGVYGTAGLFLRAHAATPAGLPAHLLGVMLDLALDDGRRLRGGLSCLPDELPLASESCKLVVVQHLFERLHDPAACASELARVLAPEGVLLVLGFNSLSLWQPWLAGKAARAGMPFKARSAQRCAAMMGGQGIDILQARYLGALSPWSKTTPAHSGDAAGGFGANALAGFRGSWLLLARKRRSALTPLRLRRDARELARSPQLAPGAHRECA